MNLDVLLINGGQIKRGRLVAGLEQTDLAKLAGVSVATIQGMEARGTRPCSNRTDTLLRVLNTLKAHGVSFSAAGGISLEPKAINPTKHQAVVA
jgi:DNA-binding transcriptional regulator YiaG